MGHQGPVKSNDSNVSSPMPFIKKSNFLQNKNFASAKSIPLIILMRKHVKPFYHIIHFSLRTLAPEAFTWYMNG